MNHRHETIEGLLEKFRPALGDDYGKYRNHVYRVYTNCLLIDSNNEHEEKYAIAAVFHDIGIWTAHTIDYLSPSIEQATLYLTQKNKVDCIDEITLMIDWHHKTSQYKGPYGQTVECFRKADWIDVSLGLITFGFDKEKINGAREQFPNLGFHAFLIKNITLNFLRHPFNPLPMFRK